MLTVQLSLPGARYGERAQAAPFYDQLLQRVRSLPGVQAVGLTNYLPLSGSDSGTSFNIEGRPPLPPGEFLEAAPRWISSEYFRAMGITIRRGRALSEQDIASERHVALINETMARHFWPGEIRLASALRWSPEKAAWHEIVGIVADVRPRRSMRSPSQRCTTRIVPCPRQTLAVDFDVSGGACESR